MVGLQLFVEGGGSGKDLRSACSQGFTKFLQKAGLGGSMPRVRPCGTRRAAYDDFCLALKCGQPALLLVDSEDLVYPAHSDKPWAHLAARQGDQWARPNGAEDRHCHLMVVFMESWFLADRDTLQEFFGQGFHAHSLPAVTSSVEGIDKAKIENALKNATKGCKTKAAYSKGLHSFDLLALIDPQKVTAASHWAKRFIDELKK
jgi:hypothetical protein